MQCQEEKHILVIVEVKKEGKERKLLRKGKTMYHIGIFLVVSSFHFTY